MRCEPIARRTAVTPDRDNASTREAAESGTRVRLRDAEDREQGHECRRGNRRPAAVPEVATERQQEMLRPNPSLDLVGESTSGGGRHEGLSQETIVPDHTIRSAFALWLDGVPPPATTVMWAEILNLMDGIGGQGSRAQLSVRDALSRYGVVVSECRLVDGLLPTERGDRIA